MLLLKVISKYFGQIYSDQIWLSRLATAASSNISQHIGHFLFSETVVFFHKQEENLFTWRPNMFTHSSDRILTTVRGFDSRYGSWTMYSSQIGRFSSSVRLLFKGLNRLFQPLPAEGHKDTWIFNTMLSIRLTGKWSHRWITLHDDDVDADDDDDDDNDNNNSDNAYWYAAIFREKSHYTALVLMIVCFCKVGKMDLRSP